MLRYTAFHYISNSDSTFAITPLAMYISSLGIEFVNKSGDCGTNISPHPLTSIDTSEGQPTMKSTQRLKDTHIFNKKPAYM